MFNRRIAKELFPENYKRVMQLLAYGQINSFRKKDPLGSKVFPVVTYHYNDVINELIRKLSIEHHNTNIDELKSFVEVLKKNKQ